MFGIPDNAGSPSNTKIFYANTSVNNQGYQIWRKPPNASMVFFTILSGGGGGGGGGQTTSGSIMGSGAGGATSTITNFFCLASILPNELYIQVGKGGQGGAGGTSGAGFSGSAGTNSFILLSQTAALPNIILYSGVTAPGGGAGGINGSAAGGIAPTIPLVQPFNQNGQWTTTSGGTGQPGTTSIYGILSGLWTGTPTTPGVPGGGLSPSANNGGSLGNTGTSNLGTAGYYINPNNLLAAGGITGSTNINGSAGKKSITPFFNSGGAGGASNINGIGGNGGDGGWGCGGGGGGAGTTAGGRGGNGGDGLVIIIWI